MESFMGSTHVAREQGSCSHGCACSGPESGVQNIRGTITTLRRRHKPGLLPHRSHRPIIYQVSMPRQIVTYHPNSKSLSKIVLLITVPPQIFPDFQTFPISAPVTYSCTFDPMKRESGIWQLQSAHASGPHTRVASHCPIKIRSGPVRILLFLVPVELPSYWLLVHNWTDLPHTPLRRNVVDQITLMI